MRVFVAIDSGVARAFPELTAQISAYFAASSPLVCPPLIVPGGEAAKNSRAVLDELYCAIEQHRLCRHSFLLAIGGGAFLDVAGFAAATAHRGVRFIRFPTTTLSQADSGVGVKNGLNLFGKKNFIGTFAPPYAVVNDFDFLNRLPIENRNDGFIEAIKVALIRDEAFFRQIEEAADALNRFESKAVEAVIFRSAELHFRHITESGDPFEMDSARPLDFGHWAAHKLEQLSDFQISHGAAVAIGLALDTVYSHKSGKLSESSMDRVLKLIQALRFPLFHPLLKQLDSTGAFSLLAGLEEFREHLGGDLTVTLLSGIGQGFEENEMDPELIEQSILELERSDRK